MRTGASTEVQVRWAGKERKEQVSKGKGLVEQRCVAEGKVKRVKGRRG